MSNIVLAIRPVYIEKIFNCSKMYEYRTKRPKEKINLIYIYETSLSKKIVGEVKVLEIIENTPEEIWKITGLESGMDKKEFFNYFKEKEKAYAFKLGEPIKYEKSRSLSEFNIKHYPQSFVYIK